MAISSNLGLGNNFQLPKTDPEQYAKQYATQNGISLEEARAELKSKYGDPQPPQEALFASSGMLNNSTYSTFTEQDEEEYLKLQDFVSNASKDFSSNDFGANFVSGPQKEGDPNFDLKSFAQQIQNVFNQLMESLNPNSSAENNQGEEEGSDVSSLSDIREILDDNEFNNFMQDSGFNDKTPESQIVNFFNQMAK